MKRTGKEGGRERAKEREREGGRVECYEQERQRSAGWGGRVSTPPRVRAVGGREKERKERERPKLEGLFLCRSFSALNVQDGQIRRGEGVTSGTVYLTVCVHECVRACVHELQLCHISQRDGRNTECRQIEALLSLRFVLSSCVCVSPRCCYVTVLILIGFDSFRCWWKYPDHMCIDLCVFWFNAHVIWNQLVVFLRTSVLCLCFTVDMAAACFHCGLVSWLFSRLNE